MSKKKGKSPFKRKNKSHSFRATNKTSRKDTRDKALSQEILSFLKSDRSKSFTTKQVASGTGLWSKIGNEKIRSLLLQLSDAGRVESLGRGRFQYSKKQVKTLSGTLQVTRSGVGFLLQEGDLEDIFIGPSNLGKALNGDMVEVRLRGRSKRTGRPEGEVVKILQRSQTKFVGTVEEAMKKTFFLLPDDDRIKTDFYLPPEELNGAKNGDKVLIEMVSWERRSPIGKVLQVLGKSGEHNTEMHAILLQYGFNPNFPAQVEAEAEAIPEAIPKKEYKERRDLRKVTTFTIDPDDAKDFDDALSIEWLENGLIEVGVHIADVSYYVRPGTELDKEAFLRGTSVYLVDRTVPMLPEKLSNKVCSLRPHEEKLTYSVLFQMDENANVKDFWLGRTVTYSDHRFTYEQAQEVIENKSDGPFKKELQTLNTLAKKLRANRMATGSIEFESNEVKFVLDENDHPIKVVKKVIKDSNQLIEDFMLLANRTVATWAHGIFKDPPLPFVYRIHDRPNPDKLSSLQQFAGAFGHSVNFEEKGSPSGQLNQLLKKVQGRPEQNVIETIAIRSMAKAVYSTSNVGHFGLGFPFYSHFTSPIRRYPDLMVHRLLDAYQHKKYKEDIKVLEAQATHSSNKERTATEAERASIKYKQVEFLEDRIGQKFTGIISGVIEAGFFVELDENLCEGFVPVHSMDEDYFSYDEAQYSLVGRETGKALRLGDPVRIEIAGTDTKRRSIEMRFVEKLAKSARK